MCEPKCLRRLQPIETRLPYGGKEQEVTERTEKGYSLCLLCFLLFNIRVFSLRVVT